MDLCKPSGFLDDGFVKYGVVECGFVFGRVGMFFGKCLWVSGTECQDNGEKFVIVLIVVPVSESKLTLAWDVKE